MQTLEIITFVLIAVVASSLFVVFVMGLDYQTIQEQFLSSASNKNVVPDKKTSILELAYETDKCWSACSFGDKNVECGAFYVSDDDTSITDLNEVKNLISKYNLCLDCNLITPNSSLPTIVKISCLDSNSDHIIIAK